MHFRFVIHFMFSLKIIIDFLWVLLCGLLHSFTHLVDEKEEEKKIAKQKRWRKIILLAVRISYDRDRFLSLLFFWWWRNIKADLFQLMFHSHSRKTIKLPSKYFLACGDFFRWDLLSSNSIYWRRGGIFLYWHDQNVRERSILRLIPVRKCDTFLLEDRQMSQRFWPKILF